MINWENEKVKHQNPGISIFVLPQIFLHFSPDGVLVGYKGKVFFPFENSKITQFSTNKLKIPWKLELNVGAEK